jgi:poly(3-hydroxybutyrate) depolymerase
MTLTRRTVLAAAAAVPLALPARVAAPALTGQHRTLPGGRTYWLSGAGPTLVVGLHGRGLTAADCNTAFWVTGDPATAGWQQHAARTGYALALGESVIGDWNVGGGWPGGNQDDLGYLLALVADADALGGPFDTVFVGGFSVGGAMAWRAAAARPDVFTAAGSASGWAPVYPDHPVDAYHTHGTADPTVPVRGGPGILGFTFPPAADEARLTRRGSRVVLYPTAGGHAVPGWMAGALWSFWTADRARP